MESGESILPSWAIGPFTKHPANPVLKPSATGFDSWAVYNPAVTVWKGRFYMFYRAEALSEAQTPYCGTSRIGLATSEDGVHWQREAAPLLDVTQEWERPGGLEDPRIVRHGGAWHLFYTAYAWPRGVVLCRACSTDLVHWEKQGPVFEAETARGVFSKSAAVVCDPHGEAVRVRGQYVMYTNAQLAYSSDFEHWQVEPFQAAEGFGQGNEVCVALTNYRSPDDNIVVFVAGSLGRVLPEAEYFYAVTEGLFSRDDPSRLVDYVPFAVLDATEPYERSTQRLTAPEAAKGTLFVDSLFQHQGRWWMHYGASDQFVALAQAPV